jgi:hypothetical protein
MIDFGTVRPGTTLYIPFATYDSNDPSASVTLTGLATTDIEIYSNGSVTQRASDAGYALLDTDGIDFDATTGIHGFSVNLADNTTAGFYASGNQYWVVVASVTVDAATINFIAATFRIGYPDAVINTTIATLASQTSFTLTNGPAEDDALNGCVVCIHDVASAVQLGFAVISDYTGSTKTVTLTAGVSFTAAATDNISIFPPANTQWITATAQTANDNGADINAILADTGTDGVVLAANSVSATAIANDAITAAKIAAGAIDAATFAADVDAEILSYLVDDATRIDASALNTHSAITVAGIADGVWDEAATGHTDAGKAGEQLWTDLDAVLVDTGTTLQGELDGIQADTEDIQSKIGTPAGASVSADIAAVKAETAAIVNDTDVIDDATSGLVKIAQDVAAVLVDTGTTLQGELDGIQADTEDIQTRLPAALTGDGNIKADVLAVSGDTVAADRLEALMDGVIIAQVNDAAATTTVFIADGFTEASNDHFNGRLITFLTGALAGQQTDITDYVGATQTITVTALTEAPADEVFFVIH